MARTQDDLSDLERDIELQMEGGRDDVEGELEALLEQSGERDEEFLAEDERPDELLRELPNGSDYVERFMELSRRPFESDLAIDQELAGVFHELERDFFFKKLGGWLKKGVKGLKRIGAKAVSLGRRLAKSPLQAFKGLTDLARGNLGGLLKSLAKAALAGVVPGGAALAPALSALGLEAETDDPDAAREFWQRYVKLCEAAYEHLGEALDTDADDPAVAGRVAQESFQKALREVFGSAARGAPTLTARGNVRRFRVQANRGDVIVIRVV